MRGRGVGSAALLTACALTLAACGGSSGGGESGAAAKNGPVLLIGLAKGELSGELLVVDEHGEQQGRVRLGDISPVAPVARARKVLFKVGDDKSVIVDATTAKAVTVRAPSGTGDLIPLDPGHLGDKFATLGTPERSAGFLVDLATGAATDLVAEMKSNTKFVSHALLSPDESAVVVSDGNDTWLVHTASPKAAERIAKNALPAGFSVDGKDVLLVEHPAPKTLALAALPIAGGEPVELAKGDPSKTPLSALVPLRGDAVAFQEGTKVVTVHIGDPKNQKVLATGVKQVRLLPEPGGNQILMGDDRKDDPSSVQWSVLDVSSAKATRLAGVDGLALGRTSFGTCALLENPDFSKPPFAVVDMAHQKVGPVLDVKSANGVPLGSSSDGCTVAVTVIGSDSNRDSEGAWVITADRQPDQIDTNRSATAAISPDGKLAYVTERDKDNVNGFILDLGNGKRTDAVGGLAPRWVAA